jgi:long-chain acyl-CoA synthetase
LSAVDRQPTQAPTLCHAFQASAARVPERVALRTQGDATRLTWAEYAAAVERVAGSLAAAGVGRGDRVAFFSRNRPELSIAEVAVLHLGAVGVALYAASPPPTIEHVLSDSEPTVLLVESALEARLADVDHAVTQVLALDAGGSEHQELASIAPAGDFDFDAAWRAVETDDLAALIYTSGTTSLAKGVEWTHGMATGCLSGFDAVIGERDEVHDISFAPFAHLSERFGSHWYSLMRGATRTVCADPAQLGAVLLDTRPTQLGGSPQLWQRLKRALDATLDADERAALDTAIERVRALVGQVGASPPPLSQAQEATLAVLRARVGLDRMAAAVVTAAPCPVAVHEHYHALGVPFQEIFAMTEIGAAAAQAPGLVDFGTLGGPAPGYELRIARDGEVLVRSPNAPRRYRNRPRESAETYGADGWIHTGDVGELDAKGRLRLVGRKKEMLIPEHGINVTPARIELVLMDACPQISQVCVVGDGRPYLAALIAVDPPEQAEDDQTRAAVANAIGQVNEMVAPHERIEAHALLADAWLPGAELTETLKMRRPQIAERYATTIERLYAEP